MTKLNLKNNTINMVTKSVNRKSKVRNYKISNKNEKGKVVKSNFIYSSDNNPHFFNIKELQKLS